MTYLTKSLLISLQFLALYQNISKIKQIPFFSFVWHFLFVYFSNTFIDIEFHIYYII